MSIHVTKLSNMTDRELLAHVSACATHTDIELELMMRLDDALEIIELMEHQAHGRHHLDREIA